MKTTLWMPQEYKDKLLAIGADMRQKGIDIEDKKHPGNISISAVIRVLTDTYQKNEEK